MTAPALSHRSASAVWVRWFGPALGLSVSLTPWGRAVAQDTAPASAPTPGSQAAAPTSAPAPVPEATAPSSAPAPPTPPVQSPAVQAGPASAPANNGWSADFSRALSDLEAGSFQDASLSFRRLAVSAPSTEDAATARALGELASRWAQQGLVLVRGGDVGDADFTAKAVDRRSSGEMATLYTGAVGFGLGTGVYISVLSEPSSVAGVTVPMLLFGVAVPLTVYAVDQSHPLRYGTPSAITNGLTLGLIEGGLWTSWYQAQADSYDEVSAKTAATLVWLPTALGGVLGGVLGEKRGTTPGRAELIGAGGMFGAGLTGLVLLSAVPDDHEKDDFVLLGAALMANAGAVGGYLAGRAWSPGVARVRYIQLGGISGALVTSLLYFSAAGDDGDERAFGGIAAAGMAGGLALATWLTNDMPEDKRREVGSNTTAHFTLTPTAEGGLSLGAFGQF